jgi:hypothetical protein
MKRVEVLSYFVTKDLPIRNPLFFWAGWQGDEALGVSLCLISQSEMTTIGVSARWPLYPFSFVTGTAPDEGTEIVKVVSIPGMLSIVIVPRWASMPRFTMERPRPVPLISV